VHDRRAPLAFWSTVPFLDPVCGDHKIIWELNRHQYWLAIGRAYWLTGAPEYRHRVISDLTSWMAANPPLTGINWSSMLELAFRSLSWIWALHLLAEDPADDPIPWTVDLLIGLDRQLTQIERNLSKYFSPNTHLLGEALALYAAGRSLPMLAAAPRRAALGRRLLLAEIDHQIGADGGHCERSTHYHRYALDFYLLALLLARATDDTEAAAFEPAVARLASAARLLADDRGRLPHLGDDDGGATWPMTGRPVDDIRDSLAVAAGVLARPDLQIGPVPEEAFWLLGHPRLSGALAACRTSAAAGFLTSAALPETGYFVSRSAAGNHLVVDGGPHGYRNGGHAHADALSVTFSLRGVPLLIDPGTGCYTVDQALRDRLRSTALHNTLMFDGAPQSVGAGPFHWTRTADASVHRWRANAGFDYFEASHPGYRPFEHRRHLFMLHGDLLVIADLVSCHEDGNDAPHSVAVHWHLDPRWKLAFDGRRVVLRSGGERVELATPQGAVELVTADPGGLGWHAPVYGRVEPAATPRISRTGAAPIWIVTVFGLTGLNEVNGVDLVPVWAEAGTLKESLAVRISRAASVDYMLLAHPAAMAGSGGAGERPTWRVGEIDTDAPVMFCRTAGSGRLTRAALVDGSMLRSSSRRLSMTLPRAVGDLHLDMSGREARLSGPSSGARIQLAGQEVLTESERRAAARPARSRAAGAEHAHFSILNS
jgi:uncharacterized heparinase superfamily protein